MFKICGAHRVSRDPRLAQDNNFLAVAHWSGIACGEHEGERTGTLYLSPLNCVHKRSGFTFSQASSLWLAPESSTGPLDFLLFDLWQPQTKGFSFSPASSSPSHIQVPNPDHVTMQLSWVLSPSPCPKSSLS